MTDDKSYIIDPLTCICKTALIYFFSEGTRFAIEHHVLYIQDYNYLQWIKRMKNGDTRVDISKLNVAYQKAMMWYVLDNEEKLEMDEELNESIRQIVQFSIRGLKKIQNTTYKEDTAIKIILQHFINMMNDALDNRWDSERYISMGNTNNILSDQIKNNLDPKIINSIAKTLTDAEQLKTSEKDSKAMVKCVHELLSNRDTEFSKLMKDVNTKF